jgi:hypothetical protein
MRHLLVACVACCFLVIGCSQEPPPPIAAEQEAVVAEWQRVVPTQMNETQHAQHELCVAAVNAMVSETMGEMEAALEAGNASDAIAVCRVKAPEIATKVSEQFGLKIGRTSLKLRNTANTPPEWAEELVAAETADPVFLAGPAGEFGALLPIKLKAECQMCHGPAEMIDEEVMTAIAEHYPNDQAVGFNEGDLRGWIWTEAPPGETETAL